MANYTRHIIIGWLILSALSANAYSPYQPENIYEKIQRYSRHFQVPPELIIHIATNESRLNPDAIGDMNIICKRTGKPVRSRGMFQISECYFPEISDRQAFDIDFSLIFVAQNIKNGKCHLWTTCRNYFKVALK